jgi:MOSC domain-containing protein YiiM
VRVIERSCPDWSVDRLLRLRYVPPRTREMLDAAAALMPLSPEWQKRYAGMTADA